ncbi:ABC transporter-like [Moorella glycerini]|uniref:ABC transporter ATP-binding protein YbbL n=1 Tax=Neomoorella stamsii TaxID=1266720 RepID=A0A9X7J2R8_9FIRM|nr:MULTISPECIES: ATP-binding cassette domain-containing protein [Moorella]PRR72822.1 putative ABC transporter ATP-binding protein YbbL [Moorella stamsii]CEP66241.1 ABC transporter-like [Moorella glycerini]CEP68167.1 ABC transporter-like [Moorella glycerini]
MFTLRDVTFGYIEARPVLKDISLHVEEGQFILLQGPSGSGKSTLLHLLNGLAVPQRGEVLFKDRPLASYDATWLRRRVVYLQQTPVMLDASVRENLLLPFRFRSARGERLPTEDLLQDYLHTFLLGEISLEANARELSVGQKQRLALIRALLLAPEALLLDEPTASLDRESREIVEARAEALNAEQGVTVIMISHTDYVPRLVKPRVLVLEHGTLREVAA